MGVLAVTDFPLRFFSLKYIWCYKVNTALGPKAINDHASDSEDDRPRQFRHPHIDRRGGMGRRRPAGGLTLLAGLLG
jgi:hypothetical protein